MKKKIICLTALLLLIGCSNESESLVNTTSIETEVETTQKEISNEILDIEDIDWSISNVVIWDEPTLSFDYTNNSPYTILDVEMKFKLKEGITEEQLEPYNTEYLTMEYILGYNRKLAKPGDTVKFSPCCVNGTYTFVENNDQFDLTEPDNVMIAYVNSNNKIQAIYYDYASGITSDYGEKGDVFEWSDNELASYIKKPDAEVVQIKYDNETDFAIVIHGGNLELASSYAEQFINDGFEGRYYQVRTEYSGVNSENIKVRVVFDDIENTVTCSVGKLSETEQSINAQVESEPEITQEDVEEIRPEFKKAVDDMEKMLEFQAFLKMS